MTARGANGAAGAQQKRVSNASNNNSCALENAMRKTVAQSGEEKTRNKENKEALTSVSGSNFSSQIAQAIRRSSSASGPGKIICRQTIPKLAFYVS